MGLEGAGGERKGEGEEREGRGEKVNAGEGGKGEGNVGLEGTRRDTEEGEKRREDTKKAKNGGECGAEERKEWVYVSDQSVHRVDVSEVLRAKAYMLFYQRIVR